MRLHFLTFLGSIIFATLASGQHEAAFSIEVSKTTVQVGEPFEVKFVVENSDNGKFVTPDWESAGFSVLNTSQSSSFSLSRGVSTSSAIYMYQIMARDTGILVIPAASVQTGKDEMRTTPQRIEVLAGNGKYKDDSSNGVRPRTPAKDPKRKFKTIHL